MKTFFQKKKVTEEPKKSQTTSQPKENPFLSGNENTSNPFTNKSAPAQFAGLGGFLKAGKRLAGNILGGKGIKNSINDVKSHNSEKKEQKDSGGNVGMSYVLKNPKLRAMFEGYLKQEHSLENLDCYDEVKRIILNPIPQLFPSFYYLYVKVGAPKEVNLPGKVVKEADELMTKMQNNPLGQAIDISILDKIESELQGNLYDSFSRFSVTDAFENRHK